jgi:hypothetical protein
MDCSLWLNNSLQRRGDFRAKLADPFPAKSECRNWVLTDLPERLREAVGPLSAEVGYRDLTPDLVSAFKKGDFPYFTDDDHWSPSGNRIAAEAINRYLKEMPGQ